MPDDLRNVRLIDIFEDLTENIFNPVSLEEEALKFIEECYEDINELCRKYLEGWEEK